MTQLAEEPVAATQDFERRVMERIASLETRLATVQGELDELRRTTPEVDDRPWYEKQAGKYEGDEAYAEMTEYGRQWREEQRREAEAADDAAQTAAGTANDRH